MCLRQQRFWRHQFQRSETILVTNSFQGRELTFNLMCLMVCFNVLLPTKLFPILVIGNEKLAIKPVSRVRLWTKEPNTESWGSGIIYCWGGVIYLRICSRAGTGTTLMIWQRMNGTTDAQTETPMKEREAGTWTSTQASQYKSIYLISYKNQTVQYCSSAFPTSLVTQ